MARQRIPNPLGKVRFLMRGQKLTYKLPLIYKFSVNCSHRPMVRILAIGAGDIGSNPIVI